MKSDSRKIVMIVFWTFFGLFFAVSLYFNYMDYKDYKIEKKNTSNVSSQNNAQPSNFIAIIGKVISIDAGSKTIKINENNTKKDIVITTDDKTKFVRNFSDPVEQTIYNDAVYNDVKMDMTIGITFNSSNYDTPAVRIEILIQNYFAGEITSITKDNIVIKKNDKLTEIKLKDNTLYYQAEPINQDEQKKPEELVPKMIKFDDLKIGSKIIVFFSGSIEEKDLKADKVLKVAD